jgi:hypothetical protein
MRSGLGPIAGGSPTSIACSTELDSDHAARESDAEHFERRDPAMNGIAALLTYCLAGSTGANCGGMVDSGELRRYEPANWGRERGMADVDWSQQHGNQTGTTGQGRR